MWQGRIPFDIFTIHSIQQQMLLLQNTSPLLWIFIYINAGMFLCRNYYDLGQISVDKWSVNNKVDLFIYIIEYTKLMFHILVDFKIKIAEHHVTQDTDCDKFVLVRTFSCDDRRNCLGMPDNLWFKRNGKLRWGERKDIITIP